MKKVWRQMAGVGRRTASHVSKTAKRVAPGRRWGPPALSAPSLLSCFGAGTVVGCLKKIGGSAMEFRRVLFRSLTRLENRETCGTRPEMGPTRLERTKSTELFRSRHGCRLSEEPFRPTTLC